MGIGCDWFGESVRLCVNLCLQLDNNCCLLLDNNIFLWWDYVFCWTLPSVDIFYLIGILGCSNLKFHVVNRMLIICESSVGAFLLLDITLCGHILLNWDIGLFKLKFSCSK
jgi:hypothetical protein